MTMVKVIYKTIMIAHFFNKMNFLDLKLMKF